MLLDIHLGKNANLTLTYKLYDNSVSELFYNRIKQQENIIASRTQFYNFDETESDIKNKLDNIVNQIKLDYPNLLDTDSTDDLNTLHINFPKYHTNATGKLKDLLQDFNYTIHHLESLQLNKNRNTKRFLFACADEGVDLPAESYKMFTPKKQFGELYMNYPHVGKHLFEIFLDQDINVPIEQIQLTSKMSNGLYAWLGDDTYQDRIKYMRLKGAMMVFYQKIQHKVGLLWNDPKLTIGCLPLGMLQNKQDVEHIVHNKYVHSWSCR